MNTKELSLPTLAWSMKKMEKSYLGSGFVKNMNFIAFQSPTSLFKGKAFIGNSQE